MGDSAHFVGIVLIVLTSKGWTKFTFLLFRAARPPCCSTSAGRLCAMRHRVVPPAVEVLAWSILCGSVILSLISYGHLFVRHIGETPCAVGCINLSS